MDRDRIETRRPATERFNHGLIVCSQRSSRRQTSTRSTRPFFAAFKRRPMLFRPPCEFAIAVCQSVSVNSFCVCFLNEVGNGFWSVFSQFVAAHSGRAPVDLSTNDLGPRCRFKMSADPRGRGPPPAQTLVVISAATYRQPMNKYWSRSASIFPRLRPGHGTSRSGGRPRLPTLRWLVFCRLSSWGGGNFSNPPGGGRAKKKKKKKKPPKFVQTLGRQTSSLDQFESLALTRNQAGFAPREESTK